jgi:hypothetical protein
MVMDFAISSSLVRPGRPLYPLLVYRAAALLHASFRPRLATTPLRFANPSPPSGWIEDFHLQAVDHARHTTGSPAFAGDRGWKCGAVVFNELLRNTCIGALRRPSPHEPTGRANARPMINSVTCCSSSAHDASPKPAASGKLLFDQSAAAESTPVPAARVQALLLQAHTYRRGAIRTTRISSANRATSSQHLCATQTICHLSISGRLRLAAIRWNRRNGAGAGRLWLRLWVLDLDGIGISAELGLFRSRI